MDKEKRKGIVQKAHRRLTFCLASILLLTIFFYFYPFDVYLPFAFPFSISLQVYALVPLAALPLGLFYRHYGFTKGHLRLMALCFIMAALIYLKLQPCAAGTYPDYEKLGDLPFALYKGCIAGFGWW